MRKWCVYVVVFVIGCAILVAAAGIAQVNRQFERVDKTAPVHADQQRMRDELLAAVLVGHAVQQRCMVTPPLKRAIEIGRWLVDKYYAETVLQRAMLVDLESTAEAYCANNG